jgi:hypothetical protein
MSTFPQNPVIWPSTDEGWCEWFKALDKKFDTPDDQQPLGHGHRCPIHGTDPRRVAERARKALVAERDTQRAALYAAMDASDLPAARAASAALAAAEAQLAGRL